MPKLADIENYFDKHEDGYGILPEDVEWLIKQAKQAADIKIQFVDLHREWLKERSRNTVKIIKKRGNRSTVIEYKGERYVYQSDSTARGGKGRKSSG